MRKYLDRLEGSQDTEMPMIMTRTLLKFFNRDFSIKFKYTDSNNLGKNSTAEHRKDDIAVISSSNIASSKEFITNNSLVTPYIKDDISGLKISPNNRANVYTVTIKLMSLSKLTMYNFYNDVNDKLSLMGNSIKLDVPHNLTFSDTTMMLIKNIYDNYIFNTPTTFLEYIRSISTKDVIMVSNRKVDENTATLGIRHNLSELTMSIDNIDMPAYDDGLNMWNVEVTLKTYADMPTRIMVSYNKIVFNKSLIDRYSVRRTSKKTIITDSIINGMLHRITDIPAVYDDGFYIDYPDDMDHTALKACKDLYSPVLLIHVVIDVNDKITLCNLRDDLGDLSLSDQMLAYLYDRGPLTVNRGEVIHISLVVNDVMTDMPIELRPDMTIASLSPLDISKRYGVLISMARESLILNTSAKTALSANPGPFGVPGNVNILKWNSDAVKQWQINNNIQSQKFAESIFMINALLR